MLCDGCCGTDDARPIDAAAPRNGRSESVRSQWLQPGLCFALKVPGFSKGGTVLHQRHSATATCRLPAHPCPPATPGWDTPTAPHSLPRNSAPRRPQFAIMAPLHPPPCGFTCPSYRTAQPSPAVRWARSDLRFCAYSFGSTVLCLRVFACFFVMSLCIKVIIAISYYFLKHLFGFIGDVLELRLD